MNIEFVVLFLLATTIVLVAHVSYRSGLHDSKENAAADVPLLVMEQAQAQAPVFSSYYSSSYPFYSPSPFSYPSFSFGPPAPTLAVSQPTLALAVSQPSLAYEQVGFLTKSDTEKHPIILPLMGRRSNRYKMQYYTISNSGFVNTELIIRKSATDKKSFRNEYGVDELFTDDTVFVDGYKEVFLVTLYDK